MKCMKNNQKNTSSNLCLFIKCPYQTSFLIVTNCIEILDFFSIKFGKFASYKKQVHKEDVKIIVEKDANQYYIKTKDGVCKTRAPLRILDDMLKRMTSFDESVVVFHGAAVCYNENAYLFLAPTMSGKTTLVSYLSQNGFKYVTDDCIPIDKNSLKVIPHYTPIMLRENGKEVLENVGVVIEDLALLSDGVIFRFAYTPKNLQIEPVPVRSVYFIERGEVDQVINMTSDVKIKKLLESTMFSYALNHDFISFIKKISYLPCKNVEYHNMDYIKEVIKREYLIN